MKAAIYSRKSKFSEKGDSIENQINFCKEHAKKIGITDIEIYEDDGYSGATVDRPNFTAMMQDIKSNQINYLICYKLDRVSRNVSDFSCLIEELDNHNVSFVSIKENFDTSSSMGRAMMYMSSVFAQLERDTIADRVRDNNYELAKKGYWLGGMAPYGFKSISVQYKNKDLNTKSYYILEENEASKNIPLIFDKYLELKSLSKVSTFLNSIGLKTQRGLNFSVSSVPVILDNPTYTSASIDIINYLKNTGFNVYGEPDENQSFLTYGKNSSSPICSVSPHKGLIEPSKWLETQKIRNANKDKVPSLGASKVSWISGVLVCGECGSNLHISHKSTPEKHNFYYICGLKRRRGSNFCSSKNLNGVKLEAQILDKIVNDKNLIKYFRLKSKNNTGSMEKLNENISKKKHAINQLVNSLEDLASDSESLKYLINKIESLAKELELLQNKKIELEKKYSEEVLLDQFQLLDSLEDKKATLYEIIEKIVWNSSCNKLTIFFKNNEKTLIIPPYIDDYHPCETPAYTDNISSSIKSKDEINFIKVIEENTFGQRLRKSRFELGLSISDIATLCNVANSVVSSYELDRFYPNTSRLKKLGESFDLNYLCKEGYMNILLNYDNFINMLKLWINDNRLTRQDAAKKLNVSPGTVSFWLNGSIMTSTIYNRIKSNLKEYNLI